MSQDIGKARTHDVGSGFLLSCRVCAGQAGGVEQIGIGRLLVLRAADFLIMRAVPSISRRNASMRCCRCCRAAAPRSRAVSPTGCGGRCRRQAGAPRRVPGGARRWCLANDIAEPAPAGVEVHAAALDVIEVRDDQAVFHHLPPRGGPGRRRRTPPRCTGKAGGTQRGPRQWIELPPALTHTYD